MAGARARVGRKREREEGRRDSVAGRSIMGLVPPFGWRDVETFEGDVACTGILSYLYSV